MASACIGAALVNSGTKSSVPNVRKSRNIPSMKPKSPMRLTMKAFLPASAADFLQEIKADEQIAAQADAFPADEEQHVVRGEDQDEHEEHEQIEVGEEAVVAALVRHVSGGINVDEPADAGDHQEHHDGELVDLQVEAGAEIAGDDPSRNIA